MIVYGVFYNPCIHESAAALQSLHIHEHKAEEFKDRLIEEKLAHIIEDNNWCKAQGLNECIQKVELKEWERYFVQPVEIVE